ncbi:MAG: GTPase HflX [Proteobacteria bacterium]|nr:MAG: GTPase HflX [Pseudomonadota bacterium]PIE18196.1 MAG: GTPase HflX [Pseudomonadota bacterium]
MASKVTGNIVGLKASALRLAERVYRRRVRTHQVVSAELASQLCSFSQETGRQIGVLLSRRGQPEHVFIGDANRLWLPEFGRLRAGRGRLRGLRLIHTHLRDEGLTNDDLTDLALLRLDLVSAITISADGHPHRIHTAHLLPGEHRQPWRVLDPQLVHDDKLDPIELLRSLEEEFARQSRAQEAEGGDRAVLVHVAERGAARSPEAHIAELSELCRTAGVAVVDTLVQRRARADPRYAVGKGKLDEVVLRANQLGAELLIFDPDLTPAQARALGDATELKVIDRSMLILDIFAQHATTGDGKLQVELAQLRYTLPRLVAKNTMMSRLTGGIGGRGPGETKLEINRRRARERIARLERQLKAVADQRSRRRALRQRKGLPVVSIVGYTNAGKSTLLNTLTADGVKEGALAADKLFATLNPTSRRLRFPTERELIINDTVGFIHDLPEELVAAFRATLEELAETDLLVHMVDVSAPEFRDQIGAVERILAELELDDPPRLLVFNKIDRLDPEELEQRSRAYDAIPISALDQDSTRPLMQAIERRLWLEGKDIHDAR